MKPLVTNKRVLQWLCVYPLDENSNKWMKWVCISFALLVFMSNFTGLLASVVYVWKFISIDLEKALFAVFQLAGWMSMAYLSGIAFIMRSEITGTIDLLSDIYTEYEDDESFHYLAQANNKGESMWPIFFKYVLVGFSLVTAASSALSVLVCFMINGHFNEKVVYHSIKVTLPFNQSTLVGYVLEVAFTIGGAGGYYISNGTFLILFITICMHHQAFYKMFHYSVRKLDQGDKYRSAEKSLCDLIRFHNTTRNLFLKSAKAFSPLIVAQLICGIIVAACIVFQLDLMLKTIFSYYMMFKTLTTD